MIWGIVSLIMSVLLYRRESKYIAGIASINWVRKHCSTLEAAKRIIQATTQRGIASVNNPISSRRFRINDRQLKHRCASTAIYTDTIKSGCISKDLINMHIFYIHPWAGQSIFSWQINQMLMKGYQLSSKKMESPIILLWKAPKNKPLANSGRNLGKLADTWRI